MISGRSCRLTRNRRRKILKCRSCRAWVDFCAVHSPRQDGSGWTTFPRDGEPTTIRRDHAKKCNGVSVGMVPWRDRGDDARIGGGCGNVRKVRRFASLRGHDVRRSPSRMSAMSPKACVLDLGQCRRGGGRWLMPDIFPTLRRATSSGSWQGSSFLTRRCMTRTSATVGLALCSFGQKSCERTNFTAKSGRREAALQRPDRDIWQAQGRRQLRLRLAVVGPEPRRRRAVSLWVPLPELALHGCSCSGSACRLGGSPACRGGLHGPDAEVPAEASLTATSRLGIGPAGCGRSGPATRP